MDFSVWEEAKCSFVFKCLLFVWGGGRGSRREESENLPPRSHCLLVCQGKQLVCSVDI